MEKNLLTMKEIARELATRLISRPYHPETEAKKTKWCAAYSTGKRIDDLSE